MTMTDMSTSAGDLNTLLKFWNSDAVEVGFARKFRNV